MVATSKKNALVCLYKLWSAFTKNIRYIIDQKAKSVILASFGTFTRSRTDPSKVIFIPSSNLMSALGINSCKEQSQSECIGPEWQKIAPAA